MSRVIKDEVALSLGELAGRNLHVIDRHGKLIIEFCS